MEEGTESASLWRADVESQSSQRNTATYSQREAALACVMSSNVEREGCSR
jgi:hypothetical protein